MKIGKTLFIISVLVCFYSMALALPPGHVESGMKAQKPGKAMSLDTRTMINVNNLEMFCTNIGGFAEDFGGILETAKADGLYFPAGTSRTVLYSGGVWIGGKVNGDIRVAIGAFDAPEYWPGPADANGGKQDDVATNKIYKINRNEDFWNNPVKTGIKMADGSPYMRFDSAQHVNDYATWPEADGAPVDGDGNPLQLGDQMLWAVFNDGGTHTYDGYGGATDSLGVEVQATYWAYDLPGALGNTIFMKFMFINKSPDIIDSCYISLWADPDLGGASDDYVGCDTTLSLGYCYNATNDDNTYGKNPPAVGYDFMQGPIIRESANDPIYASYDFSGDTAFLNTGDTIPQAFIMGMTSFNKYINGTDPDEPSDAYGYMRGNDPKSSSGGDTDTPALDNEGNRTRFFHAGDPVKGTGWLDDTPADRRFMCNTGPFTFTPDDTQIVVGAVVVGQGADRKTSVSVLKAFDNLAQFAYDQNFDIPLPPPQPIVTASGLDRIITLSWTDKSEVEYVSATHFFEGYVIYQGETVAGPWKEVMVFDVNNGEALLFDDVIDPTFGVPVFQPVVTGTDAGVQRHFEIDEDFILGGPLHNGRSYYFAVTAYSYPVGNAEAVPRGLRVLNGRQSAITIVPQEPLAGTDFNASVYDTVVVTHATGLSQGIITPYVIDPLALTGHTYRVIFEDTVMVSTAGDTTDVAWHLEDVTLDMVLMAYQTNQSGDGMYDVIDGFLLKVEGPPVDFLSMQVVANGAGVLDPPVAGALDFGGFPTGVDSDGDPLRPGDDQQVGDGRWGFHTADNGGTAGGGTRGSYSAFLSRATRDGDNFAVIGANDYEMRFTGSYDNVGVNGGYAIEWYNDDNVFWVPFECWNIGIGTPNDPSDDYRMVNYIIDDGGDDTYNLESWGTAASGGGGYEHSVSGADNDPWTDWVYWRNPTDDSPGQAGYDANETDMLAGGGTFDGTKTSAEVLARTVLVNWNGGDASPFTQDLPEMGTVFRLTTTKPNAPADTFTFIPSATSASMVEAELDNIRVVPNPYYAYFTEEADQFDRKIRFMGLPEQFTLRIFNVAGDMVKQMDHVEKLSLSDSWMDWNLLTDQGLPVASGIYIWYLESEGIGTKYGKFAVIQEVEQLNTY